MKPTPIHPLYRFAFLTLFLLLLPLTSFAHDFEAINNGKTIYYNKISDTECEVTYYDNDVLGETYSGDITIPATVTYDGTTFSVTSIGDYAFCECTSLTSISIPNSLKSIGNDAFWYCRSLTTITLPNSITSIGEDAFHGCTSLTSITLPNSITSIGNYTFLDCPSLTSITLPNSITSIGEGAFVLCTSLTSISLPNSITSIGECAFEGCTSLTSITVDPSNPNYSSLDGVLFNKDRSLLICCPSGKKANYYIVPSSVSSIGSFAFSGCESLISITLPNSITFIGNYAFLGCTSLTSISLPNTITSIGEGTFSWCTSLTSITLPNSITSIGEFAFEGCTSFTSVTNLATTPQPISRNVFDGVPLSEATLYVPIGTKSLYASAKVWRDFGTITEIDASSISAVTPDGETTCDQIYTIDGRQISNQQNSSKASHPHTITIRHHSDGTISKQIIR